MLALLSTLQSLPDAARAEAERELLPVARDAALGALAVDVAHDVGNALFGLIGLVDLALDGTPIDPERARLIKHAEADVDLAFRPLVGFARSGDDVAPGDLTAAVEQALAVYRRGRRKLLELETRLPAEPVPVACPRGLLLQAVVHVLLAADPAAPALAVEMAGQAVSVDPAEAGESLHTVAAGRIAADHGGALERNGSRLRLRFS